MISINELKYPDFINIESYWMRLAKRQLPAILGFFLIRLALANSEFGFEVLFVVHVNIYRS